MASCNDPEIEMNQGHEKCDPVRSEAVVLRKCKSTPREKVLLVLLILLFVLLAVCVTVLALKRPVKKICLSKHCVRTASMLLDAIDGSVDPCEHFYNFACGRWMKRVKIPSTKSSYTKFATLEDALDEKLRRLLEEGDTPADTSATWKAKRFYKSCMNVDVIEKDGKSLLLKTLRSLGGWPVLTDRWSDRSWNLADVLARMKKRFNNDFLVVTWVDQDDANSSVNVLQLGQPSLGMHRDHFLENSSSPVQAAYVSLMLEIAELLGARSPKADIDDVFRFEKKLAGFTASLAERQKVTIYRKFTFSNISVSLKGIDWIRFFKGFLDAEQMKGNHAITTFSYTYLKKAASLINKTPARVLANYLLWRLARIYAPKLMGKFLQAKSKFEQIEMGISGSTSRYKQCVQVTNEKLGKAVGKLYVTRHFRPQSKVVALEMIHNIRSAFNEMLEESDWMDDDAKVVAKEKANSITERVGYPEIILNDTHLDHIYHSLNISEGNYLQNLFNTERFLCRRNLKRLGAPVTDDEWEKEPAVVNAFYNPNKNDIMIPAGIFQPTFYDEHFPKSMNYGGIGVVIGHEITHGFDDKGRQHDKDGNVRAWWSNQTIEAFQRRAECMVAQYDEYRLEPFALKISGRNTHGENIADNGGLKESYRAYRKWVQENGEEDALPGINLTHNQLFFLNYAQIWCGVMTAMKASRDVKDSAHSPGPIRVKGPLSNSADFAKAYSCPLGSEMNPKEKCSLW